MELQLFNCILNGTLRPNHITDIKGYDNIKHHIDITPSTLQEAQEWLKLATKEYLSLTFSPIPQALPSSVIIKVEYSPLILDKHPIELPFSMEATDSYERFFKAIIDWECYRIKQTLIDSALSVRHNTRITALVKELLENLKNSAGSIFVYFEYEYSEADWDTSDQFHELTSDQRKSCLCKILRYLLNKIIRLYYEIAIIFEDYFSGYEPIADFCSALKHLVDDKELLYSQFAAAKECHKTQQLLQKAPSEITAAITTLYSCEEISALKPTIIDIENTAFQNVLDSGNGFKTKETIMNDISPMSSAREVCVYIEKQLDKLSELNLSDKSSESIPAKLRTYLQEQKHIYESDISASFTPILKTKDTSSTTPKILKKDINKIKREVHEKLNHFSGYNLNDERIMSADDYNALIGYVNQAIEIEDVPSNIKPIHTIHLTQAHVRHTFYKINQIMYGRKQAPYWINFLTKAFTMFENTTPETIYRNWSKASSYESDVKKMIKITKQND